MHSTITRIPSSQAIANRRIFWNKVKCKQIALHIVDIAEKTVLQFYLPLISYRKYTWSFENI